MKPINEYGLQECLEALRTGSWEISRIADRIHELTRWIPVEERLPTRENVNHIGCVQGFSDGYIINLLIDDSGVYVFNSKSDDWEFIDPHNASLSFTHWRRIDTP